MTTKLYQVRTTVPEFHGHRDVVLKWFVDKRKVAVQRPYAKLIEGRRLGDEYHEGAVDELFDAAEAKALVDWLDANRGGDTKIVEVALPLSNATMALGATPVGGAIDFLMVRDLTDLATSPLGFTVLGYYDLHGYEPIEPLAGEGGESIG